MFDIKVKRWRLLKPADTDFEANRNGGLKMSDLLKSAQAGTVESSDILIILAPADRGSGIHIELISPTLQQYGSHIKKVIAQVLEDHGIEDADVHANDKGALDYTIKARVKTAITRANG